MILTFHLSNKGMFRTTPASIGCADACALLESGEFTIENPNPKKVLNIAMDAAENLASCVLAGSC